MKKRTVLSLCTALVVALLCVSGCGENKPAGETKQEENSSTESLENGEGVEGEESGEENANEEDNSVDNFEGEESVEKVEEGAEIGVDYSASSIITYTDALIEKYPTQDSKEIVAGVISANLEYITEEDLEEVCTHYGYSIKELSKAFQDYMQNYINLVSISTSCNNKSLSWDEQITIKDAVMVNLDEFFMRDDELKQTIYLMVDSVIYTKNVEDRYVAPEEFGEDEQLCITYQSDNISDYTRGIINNFLFVVTCYDDPYRDRIMDRTLPLDRMNNSK